LEDGAIRHLNSKLYDRNHEIQTNTYHDSLLIPANLAYRKRALCLYKDWSWSSDPHAPISGKFVIQKKNDGNPFFTDLILIGNLRGLLCIFKPTDKNYSPNHLIFEKFLDSGPILQILTGKFM
jgi:hypothetical protein